MNRNRIIVLLLFVILGTQSLGQISIQGEIRDAESNLPIPFGAIALRNTAQGTIANEDGRFIIKGFLRDTLQLEVLGYKRKQITIEELSHQSIVLLKPDPTNLQEIPIFPNDDFLYEEVDNCRMTLISSKIENSKAYYLLQTEVNSRPCELLECYYNCESTQDKITSLNFKNGRVALSGIRGRLFISLNTSQAFILSGLVSNEINIPISPLHYSYRRLKQFFILRLEGYNNNGQTIRISFKPKKQKEKHFSGELWINRDDHSLEKIVNRIDTTDHHPFVSWHEGLGEIRNASITYERSFTKHDGKNVLQKALLMYSFIYVPSRLRIGSDSTLFVKSKALLYSFDYGSSFIKPYFEYDQSIDDYRKIAGLTYNDKFWESNSSFIYSQSMQSQMTQFLKSGTLFNYSNINVSSGSGPTPLFQNNYIKWSPERRLFIKKGYVTSDTNQVDKVRADKDRRQFNLHAQIFMDINEVNKGLDWYTATVFDVYKSFCYLDPEPQSNCFVNIYFDLYEIARRNLEEALKKQKLSALQIDSVYKSTLRATDNLLEEYQIQVRRGEDHKALKLWNDIVFLNLRIDNMKIFNITE